MTESCRLITTEQYQEYQLLKKKLEIATKALNGIRVWANTGNGGEMAVKRLCDKALKEIEESK